jgi:D-methionine transport system substrate-binding protein
MWGRLKTVPETNKQGETTMKTKKLKLQNLKRITLLLLSSILALSLTGILAACGGSSNTSGSSGAPEQKPIKLVIGATPAPHAEILTEVKADLAAEGFELDIVEYSDYAKPNLDTDTGDTLANFFQHKPYLDTFNEENGTKLVSVAAIHFEPLAIYPGKTTALSSLPDGATIAVPNDITNEARALHLLAAEGLITLPANADLTITPRDIAGNPKNLKFAELDPAAIPAAIADVDLAVINGNFALGAGLDVSKILASEDAKSQAAQTYANILVVKAGNEADPGVKALIKVLTSAKTKKFIEDTYKGVVVPVF